MKRMRKRYDPGELTKAVIYYYYSTEARPCPECGAGTTDAISNCTCKLPLRRKLHPMDDESEMKNLQSYTGGYCGVASVSIYNDGQNLYSANFASNSATRLTGDPDTQRRLAIWALCSAFKERSVSPLAFTMGPGGLGGGEKAVSVLDSFLLASIADSVISEENSKKVALFSDTEPARVPMLEDGNADGDQLTSSDEATIPTAPLSESSNLTTLPANNSGRIEDTYDSRPQPSGTEPPLLRPEKPTSTDPMPVSQMMPFVQYVPQPLPAPIAPQTPVVMPLSMMLSPAPEPPTERRRPHQPTGDARSEGGGATTSEARSGSVAHSGSSASGSSAAPSLGTGYGATSVERRPEPVRLVPALGIQQMARFILPSQGLRAAIPAVSGGVSKVLGEELDERRKKAEQRKARNRESAQRSNHKRKLRIQALKDDIAAALKREMYLRAREKVLREENRSLRMTGSK